MHFKRGFPIINLTNPIHLREEGCLSITKIISEMTLLAPLGLQGKILGYKKVGIIF